jgi:dolichol-phosphate mannosyltransferase
MVRGGTGGVLPDGPEPARTVADVKPLIVLPTYNEAENIAEVLDRARDAVPEADVLVVDDASPDGTADLAEAWARAHGGGLTVLRRPEKAGLGSAYRAGFAQGLALGYDALIEMDSDLSHDPAALPALISAVDNGADLAIGSRYVPGGAIPDWPKHREYLSRGGNRYAALMLGLQVRDATAGFRCYAGSMLSRIDLDRITADGYGFQIEMAYAVARRGGRIVEVPISFTDRVRGTSKMSSRIVFEALGLVTWWAVRDRILQRGRPVDDRRTPSQP